MAQAASRILQTLPPGPKGRFLAGNAFDLGGGDWLGFFTRSVRDYGDVVFFKFFNLSMCLVVHPDDIEQVLVRNASNFVKSRDYRALKPVLGEGLLTSEGAAWQRQRKLVQPSFRHENIAAYAEIMADSARQLLAAWRDGETLDGHEEMMRVTLDIASKSLFGADVSRDAGRVAAALHEVTNQFMNLANWAFLLPEFFPLPSTPRFRRATKELDAVIYRIIRERRAAKRRSQDLLGILLELRDEEGCEMADEQLRDEIMTLFVAGHETTAIALSWAWYLLAEHPEAEAKLYDELCDVLDGRVPQFSDLGRLPYTEMVVKETMRLFPPAWGIGRQALKEFEIGSYRLPAGTTVFMAQWITHRDARFYPEPERFYPDRWKDDPIRNGRLPRFAYFPFGGGPRVCLGAGFAMMEATLLLATIAQRFRLSLVTGQSVEPAPQVTLRPKHGIKVTLHKR